MHMHNRITEKIFIMLMRKGFSLRETSAEKKEYMGRIEKLMNSKILGTNTSQSTWQFPVTMDKKDVSTKMTLSNNESIKVMNSFMQIISETFTEETNNYILLRNDYFFQKVDKN